MKKKMNVLLILLMTIILVGCGSSNSTIEKEEAEVNPTIVSEDIIGDDIVDSNKEEDKEEENTKEDIEGDKGWKELLQVNFTAQTSPQVDDISKYHISMESAEPEGEFTLSRQIPDGLSKMILETMEEGTDQEAFKSLDLDGGISQEEFTNMTGAELINMETVSAVKADVDNDGLDDIIALHYWGGTGGFSNMDLYKGSIDGEYTLVHSLMCLRQDFKLIDYEGIQYLLMEDFDYNSKYHSGYSLYLYDNGTLADGKTFTYAIDDYLMDIVNEDTAYKDIETIKDTLCNPNMAKVLENGDGVIIGNAETSYQYEESDFSYSSDIDNDGKQEYYNKSIWYPSNMGTVMQCIYEFEDFSMFDDLLTSLSNEDDESRLYTFWIDEINGNNILYLYYGKNLDFTLRGFLLR